ncbi:MAG TPA: hypothetical protein VFQ65_18310 [Kofleriaceae bacterium]|nr:hypothetical protein [Kofleriaceae bacterium]
MDTVVVPANRIERAASVMAKRYRVAWIVMLATAVVLLVAGTMSQFIARPFTTGVSDSITMFVLFVLVPVGFGFLIRRRAKRMTWIGAQAAADATIMWLVDEYRILATDEFGTPKPELAFKITPLLRREVLGAATATLR